MFAGIALMLLGYLTMVGGGYTDAVTPNYDVKYGARTTILAPMMILLGLILNGYAILKKPSAERMAYVEENVFSQKKKFVVDKSVKAGLESNDTAKTTLDGKPKLTGEEKMTFTERRKAKKIKSKK